MPKEQYRARFAKIKTAFGQSIVLELPMLFLLIDGFAGDLLKPACTNYLPKNKLALMIKTVPLVFGGQSSCLATYGRQQPYQQNVLYKMKKKPV